MAVELILSQAGLQPRQVRTYQEIEEQPQDEAVATSMLGTPVFDQLIIEAGNYRQEGEVIPFPRVTVDAVLFTVSQQKNIVATQVAGRTGTIKQYISEGDYSIQIQGAIASPYPAVYPEQEVQDLIEVLKAPVALEVNVRFLALFGITDIVITNYNFRQRNGFQNIQFFQADAISDQPIELQLREDEST